MATAGLSRAYAVLRQLDTLRTDDILHPLPLPSSAQQRRKESPSHHGDDALSRARGDKRQARPSVTSDGVVNSPSLRHSSADRVARGGDAYLMPPPPSYTDAMSDVPVSGANTTADTSFASRLSKSEARAAAHAYAPRTPSSSRRNARSPAPRPFASGSAKGTSEGMSPIKPHHALSSGHRYLRHSPMSSPHRSHVLSPVVLPALSSSEADHMLAHASSALENYFDKDDMHSVLASVAAAARQTALRTRHPFLESQTTPFTPTTSATAEEAARLNRSKLARRGYVDAQPGRGTNRFGSGGAAEDDGRDQASVHMTSAATLSSLTHSPTSRRAEDFCDSDNAGEVDYDNDEVGKYDTAIQRSRKQYNRGAHADKSADRIKPITITPSVERLLDAVQSSSQYANAEMEGRAGAEFFSNDALEKPQAASAHEMPVASHDVDRSSGFDAEYSPIDLNDSPRSLTHEQHRFSPSLSSFYTATGRSRVDDSDARERAGPSPALAAATATALKTPSPVNPHEYPIPAPVHAVDMARRDGYDHLSDDGEEETVKGQKSETRTRSPTGSTNGEEYRMGLRSNSLASEKNEGQLQVYNSEGAACRDSQHLQDQNKEEEFIQETEDAAAVADASASVDEAEQQDKSNIENQHVYNSKQKSPESSPSPRRGDATSATAAASDGSRDAFPAAYTDALPFLDYLARVNAAPAEVLLKELAAMGEAWSASPKRRSASPQRKSEGRQSARATVQRADDEVVDCLALSLLLNKPAALKHIAVPLLKAQLKSLLRLLRDLERGGAMSASNARYSDPGISVAGYEANNGGEEHSSRGTRSPAADARAAHFNSVLCAIIGLGSAAAALLPPLLQLLLQLPPPSPQSPCDVRLVGLAVRTCGAAEGLRALTRIVEERREAAHVLTAAAYALSTYAYELAGHTSVICVPADVLQRSQEEARYRLVPDRQLALPSQGASRSPAPATAAPAAGSLAAVERELRSLWSGTGTLFTEASHSAVNGGGGSAAVASAPVHMVYLQSPPPYRPTHIVIDAEAARQSLLMYVASEVFCVRRDHPFVMVLLDDALDSSLLCSVVAEPASERVYKPIWDRMRRSLHHVLSSDLATRATADDAPVHVVARGLQLPLLLYSIQDFFADEKDMLFAVESALVHALVSRAAPLFQEQALLSLCTLPVEARVHVVQPLTDFFLKVVRRYQLRHATTMRRPHHGTSRGGSRGGADDYNDAEGAAEEAVVVAAAVAAGTVCVNPLAPSSCTSSCAAALVPVFTELLQSSQWRVRHAACIGLARVGPYTADPPAIVDLFLSFLSPDEHSSFLASAAGLKSQQPELQPATVVWCLAQQQQGGVRALLRALQDAQESPVVHDWCAFQLANVDVYEACQEVDQPETPDSDALQDELVQVLGKLIALQGALEEDTVLLCVRALAEVVHRAAAAAVVVVQGTAAAAAGTAVKAAVTTASHGGGGGVFSTTVPCLLPLHAAQLEQEAATYYEREPLNSCFTVLTSVLEAALLPTNVMKALCLYLCKYGGAHGELYVCEMLLESASVAARSAAAFGLRACGAKVIRSLVLGMNDANFEVRREALDTMDFFGAASVLEVLRHRPAEHRHQVIAALRDCLLQDAGRSVARRTADTVYRTLAREDQDATQLLLA